jgi:hypothetical protein
LPFLLEYRGPRTDVAGLLGITWPTTNQSKSLRSAAKRCLIDGGASFSCST